MKAFIFPGQGSQKVGMGKNWYNNYSEAKKIFQEVDEILDETGYYKDVMKKAQKDLIK